MTFTDGIFSFDVELSDSSRNLFERVRLKSPKHPLEDLQSIIARVLAYLHSFRSDLVFSQGAYEPKEPSIHALGPIGETLIWIQVGECEKRKLERALKSHPQTEFKVYFFTTEQIDKFCYELRGSKTNWVERVQFYLIDPTLVHDLSKSDHLKHRWSVTFADSSLYLFDGTEDRSGSIAEIDIWERYQGNLAVND